MAGHVRITNLTVSEAWKETQLKILHRAYSVFFRPIGDQSGSPQGRSDAPICPKCQASKPTLAHSLWICPKVANFWAQVHRYVMDIIHSHRLQDPLLCLFGIEPPGDLRPRQTVKPPTRWEHLCYLVAKKCILTNWIYSRAPQMTEFKTALHRLFLVERLDAEMVSGRRLKYFATTWRAYMASIFTEQELETFLNCPVYDRTAQKTKGACFPTNNDDR